MLQTNGSKSDPQPLKLVGKSSIEKNQSILIDTDNLPYVVPIGSVANIYERIFDCCCYLIHCVKHNRICVLKSPSSPFIWLPFVAQSLTTASWSKVAKNHIALILSENSSSRHQFLIKNSPFDYLQLIEILRLQLPEARKFITRNSFYVRLKTTMIENRFQCCTVTDRIDWMDINIILNGKIENIWGPELVEFCSRIPLNRVFDSLENESEIEYGGGFLPQNIIEFGNDQVFYYNPNNDPPKNLEEALLKSVRITENDIERLYIDFLEHCYPSFYMAFDSFRQYMFRNGIIEFNLKRLFNAFNSFTKGFLCFYEILMGLVAIQQDTPHDQVRIKFVFRYYDTKQQGLLSEDDLRRLVRDVLFEKDSKLIQTLNVNELDRKTKETIVLFQNKSIKTSTAGSSASKTSSSGINWNNFINTIATHEFRGTSFLCRTKKSIFVQITKRMTTKQIEIMAVGLVILV
ncbi:hypothetical protein QR98_0057360 [Sarcoptes scabiei]|uniref:Uncharacterized protein n=1 Tax=Sarcoptes scabiei TaxID=52283 RepID=A0A132A8K7_SARSC|nr:hypothetical protein QR98_0057360 [Sarcoptes scabiei]